MYKYTRKCTVCNVRRPFGSDVFLAALPLDPVRCRLWVQAIGQEDLVHVPIEKLHILRYVCAKHFAREHMNKRGSRLLRNAVPTLHLPLPPLPDALFVDFPQHVGWGKKKQRSEYLHSFPNPGTDTERFKAWIRAIGPSVLFLDPGWIRKSLFVCHDHFEQKYKTWLFRLTRNAVPTIFPPGKTIKRIDKTEEVEAKLPKGETHIDHTYDIRKQKVTHNYPVGFNSTCLHLHSFPNPTKEVERFRSWLYAIGGDILALDDDRIYKFRKVCHEHFEQRFHTSSNRLSANSVPTLNLAGDPHASGDRRYHDLKYKAKEIKSDGAIDIADSHKVNPKDIQVDAPLLEGIGLYSEPLDSEPPDSSIIDESIVDDVLAPPSPVSEVQDSKGETVFSWQKSELIEADDPEEPPLADPTLALYCDDDAAPAAAVPAPVADQTVPTQPAPEDVENHCKDCREVIEDWLWWCVQCGGGALCGACAARVPHTLHYVLRAPQGATYTRTQAVLAIIRQQLQNENLLSLESDDDIKPEVKEEPADPPADADSDPRAEPDPPAGSHPPGDPDPLAGLEPGALFDSPGGSPKYPDPLHEMTFTVLSGPPGVDPLGEPVTRRTNEISSEINTDRQLFKLPQNRKDIYSIPKQNQTITTQRNLDQNEPTTTQRNLDQNEPTTTQCNLHLERKLVKVSPAEVKRVFLSHIERVITTQKKQLNVPPLLLDQSLIYKENLPATQPELKFPGATKNYSRRSQALKVTSEPKPSEIVMIDLDSAAEETVEYLEEELLDSDIETIEDHDHDKDLETKVTLLESDLETIEDHDDDALDKDYEINADDLDDLSEDSVDEGVAERGVKRKKVAKENLPARGPCESMVRTLPSEAVVEVQPLSSLEIRNWTTDRKRLRKD